jgi:hypothetical protein
VRVSYPAAALSLAAHAHVLKPPEAFAWLHSDTTLTIAIVGCVAEFIAQKCSWFDTPLHYMHKLLAPVVGAATAFAADPSAGPSGMFLAVLGGGNAFVVHRLRTTARVTGSAFFLGGVHALASFAEDAVVLIAATAVFINPQKTAWVVLLVAIACWLLTYRPVPRHRRRARA